MGRELCINNLQTELEVDIESEGTARDENGANDIVLANNQGRKLLNAVWSGRLTFDTLMNSSKFGDIADENVELLLDKSSDGVGGQQQMASVRKKLVEENQKKKASRKAPKPPRPPHGASLDAADQKLVEEITELVKKKRARIERIKMLKKMRAAKSSSWNGSLCAMLITILFLVLIVFQGISARNRSMCREGSPEAAVAANEDLITTEFYEDSAYRSNGFDCVSPNLAEGRISGSKKK